MHNTYIAILRWDCPCDAKESLQIACVVDLDDCDLFIKRMVRLRNEAIREIAKHEEKTDGTN